MTSTTISAIVRADRGGLGTLSRMFARYLGFHRTLSIARLPGERDLDAFPNNREVGDECVTVEQARWLCEGADVVLSFETWYGDTVPRTARQLGVKTVLVPMYECCPADAAELRLTDLVICPTALDDAEMRRHTPGLQAADKALLAVPFDTRRIAFHHRRRATTFMHHMGHGGLGGRNGTARVIAAWRYVKSDARLILRHQSPLPLSVPRDSRVTIIDDAPADYWQLWNETGDIYLHPTCWDALSLPMHEALASGMPVMTTRFWPHYDLVRDRRVLRGNLPISSQRLAIAPARTRWQRICRTITAYETTPPAIAAAVDAVYGQDIRAASDEARHHAERHSWQRLGPAWRRCVGQALQSSRGTP
ncbi:MAG TPA: hypothetical protein VJ783_17260 [Pirellulales bacterium]|nr:hypothetical protein [Pirellulales bacterium]